MERGGRNKWNAVIIRSAPETEEMPLLEAGKSVRFGGSVRVVLKGVEMAVAHGIHEPKWQDKSSKPGVNPEKTKRLFGHLYAHSRWARRRTAELRWFIAGHAHCGERKHTRVMRFQKQQRMDCEGIAGDSIRRSCAI